MPRRNTTMTIARRRRTIASLPQDTAPVVGHPSGAPRSPEPGVARVRPLLIHVADRRRRIDTATLAHPSVRRTDRRA
jgi:hypothetical protein